MYNEPSSCKLNILLCDDDKDDCEFFKEALDELCLPTALTFLHDGEQLMQLFCDKTLDLPDVLFLDLNMPRKNGFACLVEINSNPELKGLPVIILSTSFDKKMTEVLYKNGARHFICKPPDFSQLKHLIQQALASIAEENIAQPDREKFVLTNLKSDVLSP